MLKMLILVTSLNITKKLMSNTIVIKNKIKQFDNKIIVSGDKSISIRWVLFSSLANGKIVAQNSPANLVNDIDAKNAYLSDKFKYN